jgi:Na+/H+-dicarboxylate symporter
MAEARAMTNLVGNGVATVVIARWENELDAERALAVLDQAAPDYPEKTGPAPTPETVKS